MARDPDFFKAFQGSRAGYVPMDAARVADFLAIPFRFPDPDPVVMRADGLGCEPEQPYIHRLTRLAALANERGRGAVFIQAIGNLLWDGQLRDWHLGDYLAKATAGAGLDFADMDRALAADPDRYARIVEENGAALSVAGHCGVPTFVYRGETFFGQDRLELLDWRIRQHR